MNNQSTDDTAQPALERIRTNGHDRFRGIPAFKKQGVGTTLGLHERCRWLKSIVLRHSGS
jgi:hypothetical protein